MARQKSVLIAVVFSFMTVLAYGENPDRTPPKAIPAGISNSARYALILLGNEPEARVWIIVDGERVYVDKNANGDLTETDELLAQPNHITVDANTSVRFAEYEVKDFTPVAGQPAGELKITRVGENSRYIISMNRGVYQFARQDKQGYLTLGDSIEQAAVLRFGGTLQFIPLVRGWPDEVHYQLVLHPGENLLTALLGTPGIGPGSTVSSTAPLVQGEKPLIAKVTLVIPAANPNDDPIEIKLDLTCTC